MAKEAKTLKTRDEVPEELTWRLEDIFATDDLWEKEYKALEADISKIEAYQGRLGESAQVLYEVFSLQDELSERLGKLYTYAHMRYDQDTTNSFYQAMNARAENLLTMVSTAMSFIVPEIISI